jgi:hypothetical protein
MKNLEKLLKTKLKPVALPDMLAEMKELADKNNSVAMFSLPPGMLSFQTKQHLCIVKIDESGGTPLFKGAISNLFSDAVAFASVPNASLKKVVKELGAALADLESKTD